MDGKALAARIRQEVAEEVAELGHVGLATVLVGDDPASHVYIDAQAPGRARGGDRRARHPASRRDTRGRRAAPRRGAQRRRRDRRDPRPGAAPGAHGRDPRHLRRRAGRRTSTASIRSTPGTCTSARRSTFRRRRPAAWSCSPSTASTRPARTPSSSAAARSSGGPSRCCSCQAHATVTICHSRTADLAAHVAAGGHRRRRRRRAGASSRPRWSSPGRP